MKKTAQICVLTIFISLLVSGVVAAAPSTYTVKTGDCLWNIANANGLTVDQIKQLNGLTSDFLQIGQVLKLTSSSAVMQSTAVVTAPASSEGVSEYIIQPGDNLWSIALKYGTTVDNLKILNGLTSDALYAGDALKVTGTPAAAPSVSRSGDSISGARVVAKAAQYLGTPYRYGGSAPGGFDCSGFTSYIFKQFNIYLNRTAAGQYNQGIAVSKANLCSGDLVFFNTYGGISHVGIYAGNGQFIHSSSPSSGGVIYSALNEGYYASRYVGARRVIK